MDKKIMIVDDAMFMRKTIRNALEGGGFSSIVEAADGETAIVMYQKEMPDLVLLDITMPGKSGMEVLEEIMRIRPEGKVVMCSAIGQEMMIQKAILAGAKEFIVKPFKKEEMLKVVKYCLGD